MLAKVINEFLELWKEKAAQYYEDLRLEYKTERSKKYPITAENLADVPKNSWSHERRYSDEKIAAIMAGLENGDYMPGYHKGNLEVEIANAKFNIWASWHTKAELNVVERMGYEKDYLDKFLDREVESKKKLLVKRIEEKAGKIVDAKALSIGSNGEINGIIVGDKATVTVQTIYAGGYNIQCLHYRVLVKPVKTK